MVTPTGNRQNVYRPMLQRFLTRIYKTMCTHEMKLKSQISIKKVISNQNCRKNDFKLNIIQVISNNYSITKLNIIG